MTPHLAAVGLILAITAALGAALRGLRAEVAGTVDVRELVEEGRRQ